LLNFKKNIPRFCGKPVTRKEITIKIMYSKNCEREKSEQNLKRCREETGKGYVESN
jgi:hypothetical protein